MNQIDYTIGDEIVAIKTHSQLRFEEGQIFICKALKKCSCGCGNPVVDIGLMRQNLYYLCSTSNKKILDPISNYFFNAFTFKKLDDLVDISELTEILEQPIEQQY
jgi:hypothetical protein